MSLYGNENLFTVSVQFFFYSCNSEIRSVVTISQGISSFKV
jgi:hypothetical protein